METISTDSEGRGVPLKRTQLTWEDIFGRVREKHAQLVHNNAGRLPFFLPFKVFGIPRGGIYVALAWKVWYAQDILIVERPEDADVIVDDIIDSGATAKAYREKYHKPVVALYCKQDVDKDLGWLVFPWELAENEMGPEENLRRVLEYIGEDPNREGLVETPQRVIRSWEQLYGGYKQDPADVLKVFQDDSSDEMVLLKDIEFYSTCEHHMMPFFGKAHIAYIPNQRVVGVSKLARVLEVFSRRLQIQERLTNQITTSLMEHLEPLGAACMIEAQHFCMTSRGVSKQNSAMVTSSLRGVFIKPEVRAEFLSLIAM